MRGARSSAGWDHPRRAGDFFAAALGAAFLAAALRELPAGTTIFFTVAGDAPARVDLPAAPLARGAFAAAPPPRAAVLPATPRVPAAARAGGKAAAQLMLAEAKRLEAVLPAGARRVVLDEHGTRWSTRALADRLAFWRADGRDVAFLIGGPDGLDPALKASADETARLSDLTLPHAFVRVLLAEALYRAWSLSTGHPYHRE